MYSQIMKLMAVLVLGFGTGPGLGVSSFAQSIVEVSKSTSDSKEDHEHHHASERPSASDGLPRIVDLPWAEQDQILFQRLVAGLKVSDHHLHPLAQSLHHSLMGHEDINTPITESIQSLLDPFCLASVTINPESRVKVALGPAKPVLGSGSWTVFLVRVHNEAGVTAPLRCLSPNAAIEGERSNNFQRWARLEMVGAPQLMDGLSGRPLEYRIIKIKTQDEGKREARLTFDVGQGTQDLGFRSNVDILFQCARDAK